MIIFKLPFEEKCYTIEENSQENKVSFYPFTGNSKISFKGNLTEISFDELSEIQYILPENPEYEKNETFEEYVKKIEKTIDFIKSNQLPKLVIARKKTIAASTSDIVDAFGKLCKKYPSAFVYFFAENGISWIGAFSELLGKFNKKTSEFETMSLAGTLPVNEQWNKKEIEEQKPVTNYIFKILQKYSPKIEKSETYDHISGNIKHLRTDFKAKINKEDFNNLISELHPTPAVCGFPKEICKKAIADLENFDREFYAGFSRIETENEIFCFVNLRCGKLFKNSIQLFAGGGITALSNPEKEWQETELKMQALESAFI